ncbi:single-stranded DNA-binding protein [Pseudonocardia humida]|uniref:Single-stranded DNA-binding protein n=1 Tax=Pseudonocardia humida TaxID=2800819 RepID=A0ABT0ZU64_9PSEU|nr:single-stranded DNA-binding protein [Pseudonocardia humida]MCO1654263.1 single-stranded DNA-binding protein [Pseudonocardia humida]
MYETQVTVVGNVASPVKAWKLPNGDTVAKFRVASTPRRRRGPDAEWTDGDALFVSVTCWRQLAENVLASIGLGDPVVVRGRLYTDEYEWEGRRRFEIRMAGHVVGPDLGRCRAVLTRTRRGAAEPAVAGVGERSVGPGPCPAEAAGSPPEGGRAVAADAVREVAAREQPSDDRPERLGAPVEAGVGA